MVRTQKCAALEFPPAGLNLQFHHFIGNNSRIIQSFSYMRPITWGAVGSYPLCWLALSSPRTRSLPCAVTPCPNPTWPPSYRVDPCPPAFLALRQGWNGMYISPAFPPRSPTKQMAQSLSHFHTGNLAVTSMPGFPCCHHDHSILSVIPAGVFFSSLLEVPCSLFLLKPPLNTYHPRLGRGASVT